MEVSFLLQDPEDQLGSPLAQEEKFAAFAVICGQNPREGTGRFLAGAHFHPEGEGKCKIDGASGREKRILSGHDAIFIEPQAGRSPYPVDVVRRPELKGPQTREEEPEGEDEADEREESSIPVFSEWGLHSLPYTVGFLISVFLGERWLQIILAIVSSIHEL
jgi:hypothetical protein